MNLERYSDPTVDQAGWEAAGAELGLRPIYLEYAAEAEVSPGAQLFVLATTLYGLGLYHSLVVDAQRQCRRVAAADCGLIASSLTTE